ncbi:MAG: hypothetical protein H7Z21_19705, partial [Hymenobacter sp.]|nr:hypothetical protein [Hymenobacter sp.]
MPPLVTFESYLRYVRDEAAPAEAEAVRAWLSQPANAPTALQWMQAYAESQAETAPPADGHDYGRMLAELRTRAGLESPRPELAPPPARQWPR